MNNLNRRCLLRSAAISVVACSMGVPLSAGAGKPELLRIGALGSAHGIIERILLVYEEAQRRRPQRQSVPVGVVIKAAGITRRYVENYHHKLEEEFVFPSLERSPELSSASKALRSQHEEARKLTDQTFTLCKKATPGNLDNELALTQKLLQYVQLYRRHMGLEDSLLLSRRAEEPDGRFVRKAQELAAVNSLDSVIVELESLEKDLGLLQK